MKGLIILDFNRTIYDPDRNELIEGALDFIMDYSKKYALAMIAKGDEKRAFLIDGLGLPQYFKYIKLKEEKSVLDFTYCLKEFSFDSENTWSIGDRIRKEIVLSNMADITTIWLKLGKFSTEIPQESNQHPNYTVTSFKEIRDIILL